MTKGKHKLYSSLEKLLPVASIILYLAIALSSKNFWLNFGLGVLWSLSNIILSKIAHRELFSSSKIMEAVKILFNMVYVGLLSVWGESGNLFWMLLMLPMLRAQFVFNSDRHTYLSLVFCTFTPLFFYLSFGLTDRQVIFHPTLVLMAFSMILKMSYDFLEKQYDQIEHAEKMATIGRMAANIAHEINNPLTIISNNMEILERRKAKGTLGEAASDQIIADVKSTIFRMAAIIESLKKYSCGGPKDKMVEVTSSELIEEALYFCREKFKSSDIELIYDNQCPQTLVFCRPIELSQVFLNLLNNSYDAIEAFPQKWIKISAFEKGNALIFKIEDSGPGIPIKERENVLQPFYTTKEVNKGTGLGLSISKEILEAHQGSFYIEAAKDRTVFVLELPLKNA
ncbi:MAG: GHKL domain-containing protein [Halobacteriovoraceae bacterium]|jgi:signal transduction histidine kinase|nr:GHKL domain-containing protein [Halobacteriovoraceae bacterium]MBT5093299.1 GHKL domain-containing protein [Halobacteriovoraceae bacterium]